MRPSAVLSLFLSEIVTVDPGECEAVGRVGPTCPEQKVLSHNQWYPCESQGNPISSEALHVFT